MDVPWDTPFTEDRAMGALHARGDVGGGGASRSRNRAYLCGGGRSTSASCWNSQGRVHTKSTLYREFHKYRARVQLLVLRFIGIIHIPVTHR